MKKMKILKFLLSIPQDKLLHFLGGLLIFDIASIFVHWGIAMIIVFLLSVIKEFYDKIKGGKTDIFDIIAGMLGAVTMFIINLLETLC